MSTPERMHDRLRILALDYGQLPGRMKQGFAHLLPEDAVVQHVFPDHQTRELCFVVQSAEFSAVPEGEQIPRIRP